MAVRTRVLSGVGLLGECARVCIHMSTWLRAQAGEYSFWRPCANASDPYVRARTCFYLCVFVRERTVHEITAQALADAPATLSVCMRTHVRACALCGVLAHAYLRVCIRERGRQKQRNTH